MAKYCLSHPNQPAITMCHQCHRPICKSCTMVTPHGSFCSSECSVLYREFREKLKSSAAARRGGLGIRLVLVLLLVIGGFLLIHWGASSGIRPLKGIDVIGRWLRNAETLVR